MSQEQEFEGWTNFATYNAHLCLTNERQFFDALSNFLNGKEHTELITTVFLRSEARKFKDVKGADINWEEVAYNFEIDNEIGVVYCGICNTPHHRSRKCPRCITNIKLLTGD
jgi:hypothetical protein